MGDLVLLEKKDRVAILTLNRPDALNALNAKLLNTLKSHLTVLKDDPDTGCIIITGSEGLLGKEISTYLSKKHEIIGLDLILGHDLTDENFVIDEANIGLDNASDLNQE